MGSYVKFELEDGSVVYIESTDTPKGNSGFPLADRGAHPSEQPSIQFEKSIQSVRKMASALVREMRDGFVQPPDEVQVNFGLKASAEVGSLVIARGGVESNYNVMLRWRKQEDKAAADKAEGKEEMPSKEEGQA